MYPKYRLNSMGYDLPADYDTIKEARAVMRKCVAEDVSSYPGRLAKVVHDKDSIELKIGSKQGVNTYSYYTISVVR